jgi:DNA-binding MarR family transcriptional regulator
VRPAGRDPSVTDQVLAWLLAHPAATTEDITWHSTLNGVSQPRVSSILKAAERDGLVQRDRPAEGKPWRWTCVTPRPRARAVLVRLSPSAALLAGPATDLPPAELELPGCPREGEQVEHGGRWWTVSRVTWQTGMDSPLLAVF